MSIWRVIRPWDTQRAEHPAQAEAQCDRQQRLSDDEQDHEDSADVINPQQVEEAEHGERRDDAGAHDPDRLAAEADVRAQPIQAEQPQAGDPADAVGYRRRFSAEIEVPRGARVNDVETDDDQRPEQERGADHVGGHQEVAQDGEVSADHGRAPLVTTTGWQRTAIEGVSLRRNVAFPDERGSFMELWRASLTGGLTAETMVQANLSRSRAGVLRGMHFHLRQEDLWLLVDGRSAAAITDVRPAMAGGAAASEVIEMSAGDALFIPRRVAHGFLALTDLTLMYLVTNEYDGTDEYGFAWDDPAAGIAWPAAPTIVSDRDRSNPTLAQLIAALTQEQIEGR